MKFIKCTAGISRASDSFHFDLLQTREYGFMIVWLRRRLLGSPFGVTENTDSVAVLIAGTTNKTSITNEYLYADKF